MTLFLKLATKKSILSKTVTINLDELGEIMYEHVFLRFKQEILKNYK